MSVTNQQVTHLAHLSRIKSSPNEAKLYAKELSRIIELIDPMRQVDTDDIIPMAHPQETALRLREDRMRKENCREQYQQLAPATNAGLYLTPKPIE